MSKTRTATLESWSVNYYASQEKYTLEGTVYDDSDGEFQDGTFITTSAISNFVHPYKEIIEGQVVFTSTGSQYFMGAKWQG